MGRSLPFAERKCSEKQMCSICWEPECTALKNYRTYKVKEHGSVSGVADMKKEIKERGPIACAIAATDDFFNNYSGGIYSEKSWLPKMSHIVVVVGWGVQNGIPYWIGRNSWTVGWGEQGYFRIKMYEDNLGIETSCFWANPDESFINQE